MVHLFWIVQINPQSHLQPLDGDDRLAQSTKQRWLARLCLATLLQWLLFCRLARLCVQRLPSASVSSLSRQVLAHGCPTPTVMGFQSIFPPILGHLLSRNSF
jgi:hypothetical protein